MIHNGLLSDLLKNKRKFKGKIHLPPHPLYLKSYQLFNRALSPNPVVVIDIRQVNDIRHAIYFAQKHKVPISVRGGGHSVCGSSVVDNGIVLNMSALKGIKFSNKKNKVSVKAGVLIKELDKVTLRQGQVLPLGTCGSVGVIGSSLGGGIGYLSRALGLTCDSIERMTIVTAFSDVIKVDRESHSDLFWSLRGAGANNFGVVTEVEFKTFSMVKKVYGGTIDWPIKYGREVLRRYSDIMMSAPDNFFLYAYISHAANDAAKISIMGFSMADLKESERLFMKIKNWCPQAKSDLNIRTYLDMQSNGYEDGLGIYWKHGIIANELTDEFADVVMESFSRCPENSGGIMLDPLGGAINRVDISETAFIHRESSFICSITGLSQRSFISNETKSWVSQSYQNLSPFFNGKAYQNYEDIELDEVSCYFGEHAERLLEIKHQYDPGNIFYGSLARG